MWARAAMAAEAETSRRLGSRRSRRRRCRFGRPVFDVALLRHHDCAAARAATCRPRKGTDSVLGSPAAMPFTRATAARDALGLGVYASFDGPATGGCRPGMRREFRRSRRCKRGRTHRSGRAPDRASRCRWRASRPGSRRAERGSGRCAASAGMATTCRASWCHGVAPATSFPPGSAGARDKMPHRAAPRTAL